MDPHSAHLVNPLVEMRALLQREAPPDIVEGTIARNLLPIGNEPGDIVGIDVVTLVIGDSVHSVR